MRFGHIIRSGMLSASIRATERRFSTIIRVDLPSAPAAMVECFEGRGGREGILRENLARNLAKTSRKKREFWGGFCKIPCKISSRSKSPNLAQIARNQSQFPPNILYHFSFFSSLSSFVSPRWVQAALL